ncbi:hypothetical protein CYMTET_11498 [Cymbomonas tetramitiformis]|uniref:Uncharacterized protein n=1 Tax=Cymbomonas tetramitiformis TaxID=36881 RepID=A0AAE0GMD0_9CHLO|nr:hypothetical protein CYMTET_11498 [Cymbomonas tetramitiformis]
MRGRGPHRGVKALLVLAGVSAVVEAATGGVTISPPDMEACQEALSSLYYLLQRYKPVISDSRIDGGEFRSVVLLLTRILQTAALSREATVAAGIAFIAVVRSADTLVVTHEPEDAAPSLALPLEACQRVWPLRARVAETRPLRACLKRCGRNGGGCHPPTGSHSRRRIGAEARRSGARRALGCEERGGGVRRSQVGVGTAPVYQALHLANSVFPSEGSGGGSFALASGGLPAAAVSTVELSVFQAEGTTLCEEVAKFCTFGRLCVFRGMLTALSREALFTRLQPTTTPDADTWTLLMDGARAPEGLMAADLLWGSSGR